MMWKRVRMSELEEKGSPLSWEKQQVPENLGLVYGENELSNYNCYETFCFIELQARSVQENNSEISKHHFGWTANGLQIRLLY